jgi:glycosyltransferase involved in cell wall biosynthesis
MTYAFRVPAPRPPVVLIGAVHTNDDWGFNRANLLRLVNQSYATIAHTESERDWLIEHGAQPDRVRVMGVGIDEGELQPRSGGFRTARKIPHDAYLVAYFGQLGPHKGIDILIGAMPMLLERCPNAWLAIAGSDTPFAETLRHRLRELPEAIRARVTFLVDVDDQTKADLLGDCDVFASPSQAESFGFTTVEAWSLGKPVIVGDAPSQRSVVADGKSGFIVPHGDPVRLVDALERLTDPALRCAMGSAGRDVVRERYDRRKLGAELAALLTSAAKAGRAQ